jgi:dihydrolipoamide dehydrogenase
MTSLKDRVEGIVTKLNTSTTELLKSQRVRMLRGEARLDGPHCVSVETSTGFEELQADAILISTGSRPRIPEWCSPDGDRILTTRQCYPPPVLPKHLVVIGSGVTGVEFVHMFSTLGSKVSLLVSRQQVLPNKDAEVAAALEEDFLRRGVSLL